MDLSIALSSIFWAGLIWLWIVLGIGIGLGMG
jgi:hypothetical protein